MTLHPHFPVHHVPHWRVLVVDDVKDNLVVLEYALQHYGAQAFYALNGQEGLNLVAQVRPNLILLDLSMPVMDGWQMLAQLRSHPDYASIPVIALTAHAMEGDRAGALSAGFDGYITKPFSIYTLIRDIQACFLP